MSVARMCCSAPSTRGSLPSQSVEKSAGRCQCQRPEECERDTQFTPRTRAVNCFPPGFTQLMFTRKCGVSAVLFRISRAKPVRARGPQLSRGHDYRSVTSGEGSGGNEQGVHRRALRGAPSPPGHALRSAPRSMTRPEITGKSYEWYGIRTPVTAALPIDRKAHV